MVKVRPPTIDNTLDASTILRCVNYPDTGEEEIWESFKLFWMLLLKKIDMSDQPVFIFSASWRTGSTLLQRVLNSTENILIWGEPKHLDQVRALNIDFHTYFEHAQSQYAGIERKGIENAWTPILCPKPEYVNPAFKLMIDGLYKTAAYDQGHNRWGFKEVRINAYENALWLKKLYPHAKFIFHYRDPFSMFSSVIKTDFYENFEDPYAPVKTWKNNVRDILLNDSKKVDFFIVNHEDLINTEKNSDLINNLFDYIDLEYDLGKIQATLSNKVGGSKEKSNLTDEQISTISEIIRG